MEISDIKQLLEKKIRYPIHMEIEGDFGMFARVDTGSNKFSHPIPTFSAAKGMFESILYIPSAGVIPYKVQICNPIRYTPYTFNYSGELRKSELIKKENPIQVRTTILYKPCFRIFAYVVNVKEDLNESSKRFKGVNHAHSYQEQFNKRLKNGRNYRTPCLGLSEFLASYVGPFREDKKNQEDINFILPSLTLMCFNDVKNGVWSPSFIQNVHIIKGEAKYVI